MHVSVDGLGGTVGSLCSPRNCCLSLPMRGKCFIACIYKMITVEYFGHLCIMPDWLFIYIHLPGSGGKIFRTQCFTETVAAAVTSP